MNMAYQILAAARRATDSALRISPEATLEDFDVSKYVEGEIRFLFSFPVSTWVVNHWDHNLVVREQL